jgi:cellulase/cellobiase CelA1
MAAAAAALFIGAVSAEELCSLPPDSYTAAKTTYPGLASALDVMSNYSIATWYSDRVDTDTMVSTIQTMVDTCAEDTRLTIVVYGLPNKDCSAGYSSSGWVSSTDDYKSFLTKLTDVVGDRKVLYVVEPDAVGLLAESGGCGSSNNYLANLQVAVEYLSQNANADLYMDVGYWMLSDSQVSSVVSVIKELVSSGKLKGITLNTSNYRSTSEISTLCSTFQTSYGSTDLTCIIDTSRNYVDPTTTDWCNVLTAGIGKPPQSETGVSNLDYFIWIKPAGESDGECNGGPAAGSFFGDGFEKLWNQGYFVAEGGYSTIDASGSGSTSTSQTTAPSSTTATPSSTTATPSSTTATETDAPGTVTPAQGSASDTYDSSVDGDADTSVEGDADSEGSDVSDDYTSAPATTTAAPTATTTAPASTTATPAATTAAPSTSTSNNSQCKPKMRRTRRN